MKFVIQRVDKASVTVENKVVGEIGKGFLVLVGVCDTDTREIADKMLGKMLRLRIFADENDKTNLDLNSVNGEFANEMYEYILSKCSKEVSHVASGIFGEHMDISLVNSGPFTIVLDSDEICR